MRNRKNTKNRNGRKRLDGKTQERETVPESKIAEGSKSEREVTKSEEEAKGGQRGAAAGGGVRGRSIASDSHKRLKEILKATVGDG